MADNVTYRFIQNIGDYFPSGYFTEDFIDKVRNSAGRSSDDMKSLNQKIMELRGVYDRYKNSIINDNLRPKDAIKKTHDWHTKLLNALGYETSSPYTEPYIVDEKDGIAEMIPVRHILRSGDNISMLVMEMQNLIPINEQQPAGLFEQQYGSEEISKEQRYYAGQWEYVIPKEFLNKERYRFSPSIINKAITQIFLMPEKRRPHYVLMLAGNVVFLFNQEKFSRGSYLEFSLDDLYAQAQIRAMRDYYALFYLLVSKETLASDGQTILMDTLIEDSYKSAYEVTKDLKEGVILAVETLANEALHYMRDIIKKPFGKLKKNENNEEFYDKTDDEFESEVKDDCLTIVYRLLFILFAESRPELEILPTGDEVYKKGYSFEMLRDLEQVQLRTNESITGYFFDDSIKRLFYIISHGYHQEGIEGDSTFSARPIDSPMFNDEKLHHLKDVRITNSAWQKIIKALSLSKSSNYCGRISYANLGVNQLGAVYESLLAYRGFYAEENYIEVHKEGKPEDGTFLVPYSRMDSFKRTEILCNTETGEPIILPEGTFVYRLNGRDRQKSASFYTPEVLTRSTVKYTLKAIIDEVREGKRNVKELLDLKILEPAMGAAAFQNEVINQLAESYMMYVEKKPSPDNFRSELQKVKAYIATHNVYGVDLNATAIELGKLALWLNVIHSDMEAPFFSNRLAHGNAVIGAWLKVYRKEDICIDSRSCKKKLVQNPWWEKAPYKVKFGKTKVNRLDDEIYHFLLPDKNMLGVRTIREQRNLHPSEASRMNTLIKDWTAPISNEDFIILQRISAKIDVLLKDYFQFQRSIDNLTQNKMALWGIPGNIKEETSQSENYSEKERLYDTRNRHNNPYFKLKMVFDYWCALWFWEFEKAESLPKRREYWSDIDALLDVSDYKLNLSTSKTLNMHIDSTGQLSMFASDTNDMFMQLELEKKLQPEPSSNAQKEYESELIELSKEEILIETTGKVRSFFDDSKRFKIVKEYADRYHFFHPMLEFLEVFWLRGGFDIICGNPPWIKLEFDEKGIISEKYPEVVIRKTSAPQAREMKDKLFKDSPKLKNMYALEEQENVCSSIFLNAKCNYHLLEGQQVNLYKCILTNGFFMMSENGYMGLLHPESIYDDAKGQPLRKEVYPRLRYHFQFVNELTLFAEVDHHTKYGEQIYGSKQEIIDFYSIHNLYHPNTIDACFAHDGHGVCGGIKTESNNWNTIAHRDRIVHFTKQELQILSNTFENGADLHSVKLTSIHASIILHVLEKLSKFPTHIRDYNEKIITASIHETNGADEGLIERQTTIPTGEYDVIISGPHFYVNTPFNKIPYENYRVNNDYDSINLSKLGESFVPRTVLSVPRPYSEEYLNHVIGFCVGQDAEGNNIYNKWIDYYKFAYRAMIGPNSERSLVGCILPPKWNHIGGVNSIVFKNMQLLVEFSSLCSSIVLDFFLKIIGSSDLHPNRLLTFPLGIDDKYKSALFIRTLLLNCLSTAYSNLWNEMWKDEYKEEKWSKIDARLKSFSSLTNMWQWGTPLRNPFERRQALVEIDVISAMALGLSLQDLEMIYNIQFPVLQQNEKDTWYDADGKIVFTCSVGLKGVGLSRSQWETMRGELGEDSMTCKGIDSEYTHTIDPDKSRLYGGQQETFTAPYTRCNRIEDYRQAWEFFEKRFNK